jgi:hypothetical protein
LAVGIIIIKYLFNLILTTDFMIIKRNNIIVKTFFSISFLCISLTLAAQGKNDFSITGVIVDSISKQPIEYASVAIYKKSELSLVTGVISNGEGEFIINSLPVGKYVAILK